VSFTADDPATAANEATVTLLVTSANKHARVSGEIADQDAGKKGVQVSGATYTVAAADDALQVKLDSFQGAEAPAAGDRVKVNGRIAVTRRRARRGHERGRPLRRARRAQGDHLHRDA
jgi:hypothetical protein